jgi:hypothetical protein
MNGENPVSASISDENATKLSHFGVKTITNNEVGNTHYIYRI